MLTLFHGEMYEAFKSFDHDKLNAAIEGHDQVLKLYRKARAGRSDKCGLQLLQCTGRVDTNEHGESVLMESRFQEGPAGQSTFTHITSTPLPRRGPVGGRGDGRRGGTAIPAAASSGREAMESLRVEVE